jgi:hypothetical protein
MNTERDPRPRVERDSTPAVESRPVVESAAPIAHTDRDYDTLFPTEETSGYRSRWEGIQTGFVDEPRAAVEQADALVSQVVTRLSEVFSRERQTLEQQWGRGDNVSTEDLRVALKRYRAFFDRLLSM